MAAMKPMVPQRRTGRSLVRRHLDEQSEPIETFVDNIDPEIQRIPGTAVFMSVSGQKTPAMLSHHLRLNRCLHERVLIVTVHVMDVPRVAASDRIRIEGLADGFYRIDLYYGFIQATHVPVGLRLCQEFGLEIDLDATTFYIGRESLIPDSEVPGMPVWRERLFAFLARNANSATHQFHLPTERVVEVGIQIRL